MKSILRFKCQNSFYSEKSVGIKLKQLEVHQYDQNVLFSKLKFVRYVHIKREKQQ